MNMIKSPAIYLSFLYSLLMVPLGQCTSKVIGNGKSVPLTIDQNDIPLIKGQSNKVLSLDFTLEQADILQDLVVEIEGQSVIDSLWLYDRTDAEQEPVVLISLGEPDKHLKITMNSPLKAGPHQLELHLKPKEEASLKETINLKVKELRLKQTSLALSPGTFQPLRLATSLRTAGDDGVAAYRIPGLATTLQGSLIAVYDVRYNSSVDLQEDVDVGMSRSTDGGESWEPMEIIMDMGEWGGKPQIENGIGDPAILVDPTDNTIYVLALWLHGKPGERAWFSSGQGNSPAETGQLMLVKSEDDGKTWSSPISITDQIKKDKWKLMFNGPGKGITMRDGTLVFAGQFKDENDLPHSTIIYSKDKGESWHIGTEAKPNTTEAQVIELNDGSLMLNMRDNRGGSRAIAITKDLGDTWETHPSSRSALVEPVCMASLITYPENRISEEASYLFFSNPAASDGRYNMTIKASKDQGISWNNGLLLDEGKGWGYSCLTVIDESHLGILYESSKAHMTFQIIPISELEK
ncbi:sialidase family protein [Echinicola pacifica]|nr:sialidase family protein [Echinicola pacifica]